MSKTRTGKKRLINDQTSAQSPLDFFEELLAFALDLLFALPLAFAPGLGSDLLTVLLFEDVDFDTKVLGRNAGVSEVFLKASHFDLMTNEFMLTSSLVTSTNKP